MRNKGRKGIQKFENLGDVIYGWSLARKVSKKLLAKDQRMDAYTTSSKSHRWTLAVLAYLLDTLRVNAQTLVALNLGIDPRLYNSLIFGKKMARGLVLEHILRRLGSKDLTAAIRAKMTLFLGPDFESARRPLPGSGINFEGPGQSRNCFFCTQEIQG